MPNIQPSDLYPMDLFEDLFPVKVNLAYARDTAPNIFGQIYHGHARLWLYKDLARIVLLASRYAHENAGCSLLLYDGLRTIEAQAKMAASAIVAANPQWMEEPRLLSPPGAGAHPRAMAIDVTLENKNGQLLDMGTAFDYLSENPAPAFNPAHRAYEKLKPAHQQNRIKLDQAMLSAADALGLPLMPLPQEWWDFRFPADIYNDFDALSDNDLPPEMRMVNAKATPEFKEKYMPRVLKLAQDILALSI